MSGAVYPPTTISLLSGRTATRHSLLGVGMLVTSTQDLVGELYDHTCRHTYIHTDIRTCPYMYVNNYTCHVAYKINNDNNNNFSINELCLYICNIMCFSNKKRVFFPDKAKSTGKCTYNFF